jgi:hypothetical protein
MKPEVTVVEGTQTPAKRAPHSAVASRRLAGIGGSRGQALKTPLIDRMMNIRALVEKTPTWIICGT